MTGIRVQGKNATADNSWYKINSGSVDINQVSIKDHMYKSSQYYVRNEKSDVMFSEGLFLKLPQLHV